MQYRCAEKIFGKAQVFMGEFQEKFQKFLARTRQKNIFEFWIFGFQSIPYGTFLAIQRSIRELKRFLEQLRYLAVNFRKIFKTFWRAVAQKRIFEF